MGLSRSRRAVGGRGGVRGAVVVAFVVGCRGRGVRGAFVVVTGAEGALLRSVCRRWLLASGPCMVLPSLVWKERIQSANRSRLIGFLPKTLLQWLANSVAMSSCVVANCPLLHRIDGSA